MNDKKRLNHEEVPEIKQGEIDAWNRGKGDALRDKLLAASNKLTTKSAVSLVKMYADIGDAHYLSNRFDVSVEEVRRVLAAFDIRSIEDAKSLVNSGVIAELDSAHAQNEQERQAQSVTDHAVAEQKLVDQQEAMKEVVKSPEDVDATMTTRRDVAQRKNKEDRLRQLISEGLDPATGKTSFRIALADIRDFKKNAPHGVSHLQRRFGGTAVDIMNEVKRLVPDMDPDLMRP